MRDFRYGLYMLAELLMRACISPRLRAACLRILGAKIGANVRIYECRFINLRNGFSNLTINDDVHVGTDCLIDLEGPVVIGKGSTISPRVTIISHTDPGHSHGSPWCERFPAESRGVRVGADCWIGSNVTILSGVRIDNLVAVGAGALVREGLEGGGVYAGVPARLVG